METRSNDSATGFSYINRIYGVEYPEWENGLTKREYFAAKAMQGILMNGDWKNLTPVAIAAVKMADELIEALNEE